MNTKIPGYQAKPKTPQEILSLRSRLNEIYVIHTGKELSSIEKALDRDTFMTAIEAKDFGLIDKVVENRDVDEGKNNEG